MCVLFVIITLFLVTEGWKLLIKKNNWHLICKKCNIHREFIVPQDDAWGLKKKAHLASPFTDQ